LTVRDVIVTTLARSAADRNPIEEVRCEIQRLMEPEQVAFAARRLCLGTWRRILLFGFGEGISTDWTLTLVG